VSRSFRKRKSDRLPPFVAMPWEVLNHKAYKDLPASAAKALPYIMGKVQLPYNLPEKYSQEFTFSYREAKKLSFAASTWSEVIQKLVAFGWIDPVDRGGLRGKGKSCSVFKLSRRWEKYGTPDYKCMSWKTAQPRMEIQRDASVS